jgi:hypothetical protein
VDFVADFADFRSCLNREGPPGATGGGCMVGLSMEKRRRGGRVSHSWSTSNSTSAFESGVHVKAMPLIGCVAWLSENLGEVENCRRGELKGGSIEKQP